MPALRVRSCVIERFAKLPQSLQACARLERLGRSQTPALLVHPDWSTPCPVVLWMHGRTAHKELDSGRYLRWMRAAGAGTPGIAACALDLPGHGARFDRELQRPERTLDVLEQMLDEVDQVVEALAEPRFGHAFDLDRMAIGGMSAGGMVTLRRLCDQHEFVCASVEGTTGCLTRLYSDGGPWKVDHHEDQIARLDSESRIGSWRALPLLALHAEEDQIVPVDLQRRFIGGLQKHYADSGADPTLARLVTFGHTGAPQEHAGFGRHGNDAKNAQTEFFARHLLGSGSAFEEPA